MKECAFGAQDVARAVSPSRPPCFAAAVNAAPTGCVKEECGDAMSSHRRRPSLGVSSIDLGRRLAGGPFFHCCNSSAKERGRAHDSRLAEGHEATVRSSASTMSFRMQSSNARQPVVDASAANSRGHAPTSRVGQLDLRAPATGGRRPGSSASWYCVAELGLSLFMRPGEGRVHVMQLGLVFGTQVDRSKHNVDSLNRSGEWERRLVRVGDG